MATTVKLSSKHQIVVPKVAREALALGPGDHLIVQVRDDGVLEMRKRPDNPSGELEGLLPLRADAAGELLWPEVRDE